MGRGYTYPYKNIEGRFRPIIPIEIESARVYRYEVLIDSGADISIFHADIGRAIGLDIKSGERFSMGGVTGSERTGYFHRVTIRVSRVEFQTKVGFTDGMRDGAYGMVGQKGFFDRFAIKFDYAERQLILHKKRWT